MGKIFNGFFESIKRRKGYFLVLILLSIVAIVLGVVAAVNFGGGVFAVDLSNISYIKFLKGECGFFSLLLGMFLSLAVFYLVILICHYKSFLLPLGVVFYLYLVYSQAVIFMSIILIYGILNCIILAILLLVYSLLVWILFLFLMSELICIVNNFEFFKTCFSFNSSKVLWCLILMFVLTLVFGVVITVLKNYVILLIF